MLPLALLHCISKLDKLPFLGHESFVGLCILHEVRVYLPLKGTLVIRDLEEGLHLEAGELGRLALALCKLLTVLVLQALAHLDQKLELHGLWQR